MRRMIAAGVAWFAVCAAPGVAYADPVVPQPNTDCPARIAGALTQLPDLKTLLECTDGRWQAFDDPYPNSGRWLTYGPVLTLHGEGQRNREIDSGDWIGFPQEPGSQCNAEQVAIAATGGLSPPQVSTGAPGQPLRLRLQPLLFTVELNGYCLWQKE